MADTDDYSGVWSCTYWYPSNQHDSEDASVYQMNAEQTGNELVLESINDAPGSTPGSYLFVRLHLDGVFAAGSWSENTGPDGEFGGMIYSGVVQLLISKDGRTMTGKWAGVGRDRERQVPDIYDGHWELRRI